jgi:hypothetical protein
MTGNDRRDGQMQRADQHDEIEDERADSRVDEEVLRQRAYEISQSDEAGSPDENWLRGENELLLSGYILVR